MGVTFYPYKKLRKNGLRDSSALESEKPMKKLEKAPFSSAFRIPVSSAHFPSFFPSSFTPKRRFSLDLRQVDLIIIINNQYMGEKFFSNTKASEASFNEDAVQSEGIRSHLATSDYC